MNIITQAFGLGAMICLFLIYQQKSRKAMLLCKLSADVFWVLHYFFLNAVGGMIPNFVGIFRELVFINRKKKKWASCPVWVVIFILINLSMGIASFDNWYDFIPIIASSFVSIALWLDNPNLTKLISAPVSSAFLIYDIFAGSYIGIINESLSLVSIIIYFAKKFKEDK